MLQFSYPCIELNKENRKAIGNIFLSTSLNSRDAKGQRRKLRLPKSDNKGVKYRRQNGTYPALFDGEIAGI